MGYSPSLRRKCREFARWTAVILLAAFTISLAACGPEPTPFPVDVLDTPTPPAAAEVAETDAPAAAQGIRYALDVNTMGAVAELDQLSAAARVETLAQAVNPADLGTRFDLAAAYGDLPGSTRSPVTPHIALVVNTNHSPLDNPLFANALRQALDPSAIIATLNLVGASADFSGAGNRASVRSALANAGWPDGVAVRLGHSALPGVQIVMEQLRAFGIRAEAVALDAAALTTNLNDGSVQIALIAWVSADERQVWVNAVGAANVIDLFSVPISYIAIEGLSITFTPAGWPLVEE
jgi:hypothetical protein